MAGAMEEGIIHDGSVFNIGMRERGGCVDGVRMSTVRARSMGARRMAESADAAREEARDSRGEEEARMSSRVREDGVGSVEVVRAGSGRLRTAQKSERRKEDIVLSRILWMNVLFVPFQTPQAPSSFHKAEMTVVREEADGSA